MTAAAILAFAQTAITRPPIDVNERNFAEIQRAATGNRTFDQNNKNSKFKMTVASILYLIYRP